jgi:hypothetical protein
LKDLTTHNTTHHSITNKESEKEKVPTREVSRRGFDVRLKAQQREKAHLFVVLVWSELSDVQSNGVVGAAGADKEEEERGRKI